MFQNFIILNPIISAIFSIFFFNGIYFVSKKFTEYEYFNFLKKYFSNIDFIIFILFLNISIFLLYLFCLFFPLNITFFKAISYLFVFLGLFNLTKISLKIKKIDFNYKIYQYLFLLIIALYFLLSLSPITDPDSLEYHIGLPVYSLTYGIFFIKDYWLHSQLAGSGEALNILALSANFIHVPTFIQFVSILLIIGVIHFSKLNFFSNISFTGKYFIYLLIVSCPVFLFLVNSAKPQLFGIATSFIAFFLSFMVLPEEKNLKNKKKLYFLIAILTLLSTQIKFSFFLSCGIIMLFSFYEMYKAKQIYYSITTFTFLFVLIVVPREIYEYLYINNNVIVNFFYPISDQYLYESIRSSLRHGVGLPRSFPYWLILPSKLGDLTYSLGIGMLFLFFNFQIKLDVVKKIFIALAIYFLAGLLFGQSTGRFFVEPFLWIILAGSVNFKFLKNNFHKFFYRGVILQSLCILIILIFSAYSFFPGILSKKNYLNVLSKYADGYKIYNWSNKILPDDAVLLTSHRALSLSKVKTIFTEFRLYINTDVIRNFGDLGEKYVLKHYFEKIKKEKPTHILYVEHERNQRKDVFQQCRGSIFRYKKDAGEISVRNIFNKSTKYDGYIYEINYEDLGKCEK